MVDLLAPFFVGLLGSFHCMGMCGPLVVAYALHLRTLPALNATSNTLPWQLGVLHHVAFHSGRLATYGFLGLITSGLVHLIDLRLISSHLRAGVTFLGGVLMILSGLGLLRLLPFPIPLFQPIAGSRTSFSHWFPLLFRSQHLTSKIALGVLTGFLPCMLSWAMVLKAATTGNPLIGFLTMILFGLGTVPVLFLTGFSASMISLKMRIMGERIAALSIILMGFILVFKGVRSFVRFYL
jgi:sulfite exporter TauE/SafE